VAEENGGLDVVAVFEIGAEMSLFAADGAACSLAFADFDVFQNLLKLIAGGLRAHHGGGIERTANLNFADASDGAFHELIEDGFLN
jgi:hypothetical protein